MIKQTVIRRLIRNSLRTPDGTELRSRYHGDLQYYIDKESGYEYELDGGLDYPRWGVNPDAEDTCLYDDQPHEVQREVLEWSYMVDGSVEWVKVKDLELDEIRKILSRPDLMPVLTNCLRKELAIRAKD